MDQPQVHGDDRVNVMDSMESVLLNGTHNRTRNFVELRLGNARLVFDWDDDHRTFLVSSDNVAQFVTSLARINHADFALHGLSLLKNSSFGHEFLSYLRGRFTVPFLLLYLPFFSKKAKAVFPAMEVLHDRITDMLLSGYGYSLSRFKRLAGDILIESNPGNFLVLSFDDAVGDYSCTFQAFLGFVQESLGFETQKSKALRKIREKTGMRIDPSRLTMNQMLVGGLAAVTGVSVDHERLRRLHELLWIAKLQKYILVRVDQSTHAAFALITASTVEFVTHNPGSEEAQLLKRLAELTISRDPYAQARMSPAADFISSLRPEPFAQQMSVAPSSEISSAVPNIPQVVVLREKALWKFVQHEFTTLRTAAATETIGLLLGNANSEGKFVVDTVFIPDQVGDSTSCEVTELGTEQLTLFLIDMELACIGWIHTHPKHDNFLSSVDLHNSFAGFQRDNPSAVAVVYSALDESLCAYSLTPTGMEVVGACGATGFHTHTCCEDAHGDSGGAACEGHLFAKAECSVTSRGEGKVFHPLSTPQSSPLRKKRRVKVSPIEKTKLPRSEDMKVELGSVDDPINLD